MMQKTTQRWATCLNRSVVALSRARATPSYHKHITSSVTSRITPSTFRPFHAISTLREEAAASHNPDASSNGGVVTRFEELGTSGMVHPTLVDTLTTRMGLETMTDVQTATINEALSGTDVIAQARTGTGKTLAFLLPIVQNIINVDPSLATQTSSRERRGLRTTADDIRAIVISPTRELAEQIAVEAEKLVQSTGIIVQTAVGGTQKREGLHRIQSRGCHILVATPGRLNDLLTDPQSRVQAPDLSALVLDEADRLMDAGFWPAIQDIMDQLPRREEVDRQTMMFSATVPREVVTLVRSVLKPGFKFVQCVSEEDEQTHARVDQKIVITRGLENKMPALIELMYRAIEELRAAEGPHFKALVFFNSNNEVELYHSALMDMRRQAGPLSSIGVYKMHGKMAQEARTRSSGGFRECHSGVLVSSDVTARGLDFPNVTHVIQLGIPGSMDQYVHRLGRTGRAGKSGQGWILASEAEVGARRRDLRQFPIKKDDSLQTATLDLSREADVPAQVGAILGMVQDTFTRMSIDDKRWALKSMMKSLQLPPDLLPSLLDNLARYGLGMPGYDPRDQPRGDRYAPGGFGSQGGGGFGGDFGGRGGSSRGFDRGGSGGFDRGSGGRFGGRSDGFDRGSGFGSASGGSRSFDRGNRGGFDRGSGGFGRGDGRSDRGFGGGNRGFDRGSSGFDSSSPF